LAAKAGIDAVQTIGLAAIGKTKVCASESRPKGALFTVKKSIPVARQEEAGTRTPGSK
jgi:hypothetical protein